MTDLLLSGEPLPNPMNDWDLKSIGLDELLLKQAAGDVVLIEGVGYTVPYIEYWHIWDKKTLIDEWVRVK